MLSSRRNGQQARQHAARQRGPVLRLQDAEGDGDAEDDGRAEHGADDETAELPRRARARQLHGKGRAAHVVCQDRACEHGRVRAEEAVDRHEHRPQQPRQHGRERKDAEHGEAQRADGEDALLKLLPKPEAAAEHAVERAEDHGDGHDPENDVIHELPPFRPKWPRWPRLRARPAAPRAPPRRRRG